MGSLWDLVIVSAAIFWLLSLSYARAFLPTPRACVVHGMSPLPPTHTLHSLSASFPTFLTCLLSDRPSLPLLQVVLFALCSCFDGTGTELPESETGRSRRWRQAEKDAGKLRPSRRTAPNVALDVEEALRERAWLAVRMLTMSCGLAMRAATHPGVLKACSNFMVQVFECICRELKLSLALLQRPKSKASVDGQDSGKAGKLGATDDANDGSEAPGSGRPGVDVERYRQHCAQLLSLVGVVLQHPTQQVFCRDCGFGFGFGFGSPQGRRECPPPPPSSATPASPTRTPAHSSAPLLKPTQCHAKAKPLATGTTRTAGSSVVSPMCVPVARTRPRRGACLRAAAMSKQQPRP